MSRSIEEIDAEVSRVAGAGVAAMAEYLEDAVRQTLGVQAPLRVTHGPAPHLVAATPATPGAPPRRVTSRMYYRVAREQVGPLTWQVGIFGGIPYPARHEFGRHPWLEPTLERELPRLDAIAGQAVRAEVRT